jgi:hypothetical protein
LYHSKISALPGGGMDSEKKTYKIPGRTYLSGKNRNEKEYNETGFCFADPGIICFWRQRYREASGEYAREIYYDWGVGRSSRQQRMDRAF